jgi:copper(I)-binding protein
VTRWNRRLLLGAVALLVPVLAGCEAGLNAPTLQFHPASNGATVVQNDIRIDNAFVLAPSSAMSGARAGTFLSIQAQNGDRLVSVSAPDAASSVQLAGGPVDLPAQTLVDLSGPVPQVVLTGLTNPLSGGETVQMNFTFAEAGVISLAVPVEPNTDYYATYSPPPIPTPSATGTKKARATAPGSATASTSASPTATP